MQKLSMDTTRDLEEENERDTGTFERDTGTFEREAEEYHLSMLAGAQPARGYNDLSGEAERALRSAPSLTWKEFFKKWGC